jgi:predicted Zn-dependent protease
MNRRLMVKVSWAAGLCVAAAVGLVAQQSVQDDEILKAMSDEMQRAKTLKVGEAGPPYYVEYALDDMEAFSVTASMGGILGVSHNRERVPRVEVRAGGYDFDNTNFPGGRGGNAGRMPVDGDPQILRRGFWLATDAYYKNAIEALTRKKTSLMNVTQVDKLNDFAKAEPVTKILPLRKMEFKNEEWKKSIASISGVFKDYPKIVGSTVSLQVNYANSYFLNSEGSAYRFADDLITYRVNASAQAADGMPITHGESILARNLKAFGSENELRRAATDVAKNVTALVSAPMGENYAGPVLFEGVSSAQFFAQMLGPNLSIARRITAGAAGGRGGPAAAQAPGELEGRVGSKVLPEWMDVVDDATQESYKGRELLGYYPIDMEAVAPKPLTLIERGTLKGYLLTRQPVRGYEGSNGHARLPGGNGAKQAVYSNLFIQAKEKVTEAELKRKLMEMVQARGKAYGIIVRKLDFPQTGSTADIRRRPGSSAVTPPLLVYKVFPDGREELVRGLSFSGVTLRSLRDINAASDQEHIFDYVAGGGGNYVVGHSVIAPSVLFEDMEFERRESDWPQPPIVPPPAR